tara:strand:+ start:10480 stop:11166 length:687 start_codon:yes stop_codon:yes gene_type:complete
MEDIKKKLGNEVIMMISGYIHRKRMKFLKFEIYGGFNYRKFTTYLRCNECIKECGVKTWKEWIYDMAVESLEFSKKPFNEEEIDDEIKYRMSFGIEDDVHNNYRTYLNHAAWRFDDKIRGYYTIPISIKMGIKGRKNLFACEFHSNYKNYRILNSDPTFDNSIFRRPTSYIGNTSFSLDFDRAYPYYDDLYVCLSCTKNCYFSNPSEGFLETGLCDPCRLRLLKEKIQ